MHPLYSIPMFITSGLCAGFGLFVLFRKPKEKLNRLFCFLAFSVAAWSLGYGFVYVSSSPSKALQMARLGYIGVVFIPTLFYHFMCEYLQVRRKAALCGVYAGSLFFLYLSRANRFFNDVYTYFWGYYPRAGTIYWTFLVFFYGVFGLCLLEMAKVYREIKSGHRRDLSQNQVKYVLLAYFVATLSVSDYLPNYHIEIYPFAYLAATSWLALMAYAIFKHRLMDVNVVIRKTLLYSFVTAGLASVYAGTVTLLARLVENHPSVPALIPSEIFIYLAYGLRISFPYSCVIMAFLCAGFGIFVWVKGLRQPVHRLWMFFCLAVGFWSLGKGMMVRSGTFAEAYFWQQWFLYTGAIMIPIVFLHFVMVITENQLPDILTVGYLLAGVLQIMNVAGYLVSIKVQPPFNYYTDPLKFFWLFLSYFFGLVLYAHVLLIRRVFAVTGQQRNQIKFILLGTAIGFCGGSTSFFLMFNIPIFPYGIYAVPIYIVTVSYAIFKHQLMDITVVIRKTLLYSLVSAALASVYVGTITLLAHLLGGHRGSASAVSSALAAIFITLLFNPLRNRLQVFIDRKFARSRLVGADQLAKLSSEVIGHENLEKIADSMGHILDEALHPQVWALYLRAADDREFVKVVSTHGEGLPESMPLVNPWSNYFLTTTGSIPMHPSPVEGEGVMAIAVPLMGGRDLLGYLLLGEKKSEETYTEEDRVLLRMVANQAAVAFERSKMVQRISGAFVHEIKMPLANIALPAELTFMDMEDLAAGKKSTNELIPKVMKRMKYIMDQALLAGTRVDAVREAAGADELLRGKADLGQVLENSLKPMESLLREARVEVHKDVRDSLPLVSGSARQLEIVFGNLIKNAAEAMAQSPGQRRELQIRAYEENGQVITRIQDTGPGIDPANRPFLFTSRYSTKGAQGSGIGLFLSRQIIEAHGGSITAGDNPDGGAEFTIVIPMAS